MKNIKEILKNRARRITIISIIAILLIAAIAAGITIAVNERSGEPETDQTFTEEGDGYYIWVRAVDHAGNKSDWSEAQRIWIDTGAPKITIKTNSNTSWAKTGSVTVALQDSKSGLAAGASVKYGWSTSLDTLPSSYTTVTPSYTAGTTSEVTFTAEASGLTGKYYLWVVPTTFVDTAGNSQTTTVKSTGQFYFDNNKPTAGTVTMKLGSSSGNAYSNDSWTNQSVYVAKSNGADGSGESGHSSTTWTIAGTAESGTNKTLDPGSGKSATYSIVVTTADVAGNTASNTYTVKIDKAGPTLSIASTVNGTAYSGGWTVGPITPKLTFSDSNSGIDADSLEYKVGTGNWTNSGNTSTTTFTGKWSSNNDTTGYYRIADNAGNYSEVSFPVKIDTVSPTVAANNTSLTITQGDSKTFASLFTVTWGGITTGTQTYTLNNASTSYTNTNQLAVGTHTLKCTANKNNGTSANASVTITVKAKSTVPEVETVLIKKTNADMDTSGCSGASKQFDVTIPVDVRVVKVTIFTGSGNVVKIQTNDDTGAIDTVWSDPSGSDTSNLVSNKTLVSYVRSHTGENLYSFILDSTY